MSNASDSNTACDQAGAGHLVCVIDDDDELRETLAKILSHSGFRVVLAQDGEEGLETVATSGARIVVTDIVMPTREGIETIRELKRRFPGIRILAISGGGRQGAKEYLEVAVALGADDCLPKPFRAADLVTKVSSLAAGGAES